MDDLRQLGSGSYVTPGGAEGTIEPIPPTEAERERARQQDAEKVASIDKTVEGVKRTPPDDEFRARMIAETLRTAKGSASEDPIPLAMVPNPPEQYRPRETPPIRSGNPDGGNGGGSGTTCVFVSWDGGSATAHTGLVTISNILDFSG